MFPQKAYYSFSNLPGPFQPRLVSPSSEFRHHLMSKQCIAKNKALCWFSCVVYVIMQLLNLIYYPCVYAQTGHQLLWKFLHTLVPPGAPGNLPCIQNSPSIDSRREQVVKAKHDAVWKYLQIWLEKCLTISFIICQIE
jgi:hypothetical protein